MRVISKTLSVSTQQLLEESGRQEFVGAVDADLTEEESGKTDLECLARKQSSLSGKESAQGCVPQRLLGRPA